MSAEEIAASMIRHSDKDTISIGGIPESNPGFLAERVARNRVARMQVAVLVDNHVRENLNDPDAVRHFRLGLRDDQIEFLERMDKQRQEEEDESN